MTTEPPRGGQQQSQSNQPPGQDHIDAINAVFTLLEGAFPLKYRRAFPDNQAVDASKRVWLQSLKSYPPRRILRAARKAIDTARFFPDLADIRQLCKLRFGELGLQEPLQAYYEACNARNRTRDGLWSHVAVYLAAKETGWSLLEGEPQQVAFPVFERNYNILCERIMAGEDLEAEILKGLANPNRRDVVQESQAFAERKLRDDMDKHGINPDGGRDEFLRAMKEL
ncbi:replication protein P [Parendozoicomonas sp. Alg238-R29]|uniref:replication protein P n=1 Tax=Parendozoicomonas sp. Alg238-R29 TaxID=2993446 RepID=UPI00248EFDB3|nr:replication protein P [Parendozoicomonas sp. Alg238-R29]